MDQLPCIFVLTQTKPYLRLNASHVARSRFPARYGPHRMQLSYALQMKRQGLVPMGPHSMRSTPPYMSKEIIINATSRETRIAIVDQQKLVEFYIESPDNERTVGDIYLGCIDAIRSGLRAAFVNIGEDQHGFLHFSDLTENLEQQLNLAKAEGAGVTQIMQNWEPRDPQEPVPANSQRRRRGDFNLLKPKQSILVTITKEPYHSKRSEIIYGYFTGWAFSGAHSTCRIRSRFSTY